MADRQPATDHNERDIRDSWVGLAWLIRNTAPDYVGNLHGLAGLFERLHT